MAYLTILAAVPEERILAFQRDPQQSLKASLVREVSHLIAYWVKVQPLGTLLGEVIDGGKTLHDSLWHPLRPPLFHEPRQIHLTLHFLGEADVERTSAALWRVHASAFNQTFAGVGLFPSAGGSTTLWAGVAAAPGLLELRAAISTALADHGFRQEARPYNPHLTLARCESGFPARVIEDFLRIHSQFSLPAVPITTFGLFSSTLIADVPVYLRERGFPLQSAARKP